VVFDVACAADEAYTPHAAAMLHSVIATNPTGSVHAHFLHPPELPERVLGQLSDMVEGLGSEISFHEVVRSGLQSMGRISEVMWFRLALPSLLPDTARVLYLDCDTLALAPLAPLWELDLQGSAVGAVTNVFPPDLVHRPGDLGLAPAAYFNSGVLLMDLDSWRERQLAERIVQRARSEPSSSTTLASRCTRAGTARTASSSSARARRCSASSRPPRLVRTQRSCISRAPSWPSRGTICAHIPTGPCTSSIALRLHGPRYGWTE
jgi:lipopolysaccharide biosynthesis glycosyltransferase